MQILGIYQYITIVYGLKNHNKIYQEDLMANSVKPSSLIIKNIIFLLFKKHNQNTYIKGLYEQLVVAVAGMRM